MFKLILATVLALSTSVSLAYTPDNYTAVVDVKVEKGRQNWTGSGTLVAVSGDKALILSCRHVAPTEDLAVEIIWRGLDGQVTSGKVVAVVKHERMFKWFRFRNGRSRRIDIGNHFETDLALIETDYPGEVTPVTVAKFNPEEGPWNCLGYRDGKLYKSVATEAAVENGVIKCNTYFLAGNSGGAMLNKDGHLVGVLVGTAADKSYGVAANGEHLHNLLEGFGKSW